MIKIFLDTNFLLIPGKFKIDIFSEIDRIINEPYQIFVLEGTIEELHKINNNSREAKIALQLIEQIKEKSLYMHIDSKDPTVDDSLVNLADKNTIVATQDKNLRKRLAKKGIKTIILRGKKHLELKDVL